MIKRFCDICEAEIDDRNDPKIGSDTYRLNATIQGKYKPTGATKLKVEILTSLDGTSNKGDFCKYCILDALYKLDDRPKCV